MKSTLQNEYRLTDLLFILGHLDVTIVVDNGSMPMAMSLSSRTGTNQYGSKPIIHDLVTDTPENKEDHIAAIDPSGAPVKFYSLLSKADKDPIAAQLLLNLSDYFQSSRGAVIRTPKVDMSGIKLPVRFEEHTKLECFLSDLALVASEIKDIVTENITLAHLGVGDLELSMEVDQKSLSVYREIHLSYQGMWSIVDIFNYEIMKWLR